LKMKIYLDTCCLNRPYDDQTQARIFLESEAVLRILRFIQNRRRQLVGSDAIEFENSKNPKKDVRNRIVKMLQMADHHITIGKREEQRAKVLSTLGFDTYDALHLACAESAGANGLLTTDDDFLRCAKKNAGKIDVQVYNPIEWIAEVEK